MRGYFGIVLGHSYFLGINVDGDDVLTRHSKLNSISANPAERVYDCIGRTPI